MKNKTVNYISSKVESFIENPPHANFFRWIGKKLKHPLESIVDALANLEPLPTYTNKKLAQFALGVWLFAISLNWLGNIFAFVFSAFLALCGWAFYIFMVKPTNTSDKGVETMEDFYNYCNQVWDNTKSSFKNL